MMKSIFDPVKIGGISARNRIVRSATAEGFADEEGALLTGAYIRLYEALAKGGTGVIVTGLMGVDGNARGSRRMARAYGDDFVPALRQIADAVHACGCKIVVQLVHAGARARTTDNGEPPLSVTDTAPAPGTAVRRMEKKDVAAVAESFALAARRCKEAGADGVQIHGAHGFLITQMLSPFYNDRTDEYGGNIANRGRPLLDILDAMRRETGKDFPIWIKINGKDLVEKSITPEELLYLGKELEKHGMSAIEVSAGIVFDRTTLPFPLIRGEEDEGCFAPEALALANGLGITVISVGGYRTPEVMERWLNQGKIEALSLSRPLICEPDLIRRWQEGHREKSRCVSCNKCLETADGFGCKVFPHGGLYSESGKSEEKGGRP